MLKVGQTRSIRIDIQQGASSAQRSLPGPSCPGNTEFLITSLFAAPDISNPPSGAWALAVDLVQKVQIGGVYVALAAYGTGPQHASAVLGGGQALLANGGPAGTINLTAKLFSGPTQTPLSFYAHISGYCGVAWVSPGQF